jgi:hypothetical protein
MICYGECIMQCICENKFLKYLQLSRIILFKRNLNRIPNLILLRHKNNYTATLINKILWIGNPPRALISFNSKFQPDGYQIAMKLCQNILKFMVINEAYSYKY